MESSLYDLDSFYKQLSIFLYVSIDPGLSEIFSVFRRFSSPFTYDFLVCVIYIIRFAA